MTCEACYFPKDDCRCFSRGEGGNARAVANALMHAEDLALHDLKRRMQSTLDAITATLPDCDEVIESTPRTKPNPFFQAIN